MKEERKSALGCMRKEGKKVPIQERMVVVSFGREPASGKLRNREGDWKKGNEHQGLLFTRYGREKNSRCAKGNLP